MHVRWLQARGDGKQRRTELAKPPIKISTRGVVLAHAPPGGRENAGRCFPTSQRPRQPGRPAKRKPLETPDRSREAVCSIVLPYLLARFSLMAV